LLATFLVLVRHLAAGTATLALPFFSSRPCIVVLALIPAAATARIVQRRKASAGADGVSDPTQRPRQIIEVAR
jgi:hypothetical protein